MEKYIARNDCSEFHQIVVDAPPEAVYEAALKLDLSGSRAIRFLFFLRGLYARLSFRSSKAPSEVLGLTLQDLIDKTGFMLLETRPPVEIIIGTIGQFWNPMGGLVKGLSAEEFKAFDKPGYVKSIWNFEMIPQDDGATLLTTETCNECLGKKARLAFRMYWVMIHPLSGASRRMMLKQIANQAAHENALNPVGKG